MATQMQQAREGRTTDAMKIVAEEERIPVETIREHGVVTVRTACTAEEVWVEISDDGDGFDWRRFLDFDPERAFAPNGRGIALSRQLSFSSLTYIPPGNRVVVTVPRDEASK